MNINTKIRYGLRTIIEIADPSNTDGVLQKDIARNQNISNKYLDSIIMGLKLKGLIANTRGKGSGYKLTRPAEEITMFDIYTSFEKIEIVECINNKTLCERQTHDCTASNYWMQFAKQLKEMLQKKTLAQIIEETCYLCNDLENR